VNLQTWETDLKTSSTNISSQLSSSSSIPEARTVLVQFLQDATNTTSQLVQEYDQIGVPKTKHGQNVATLIHNGIVQVETLFSNSVQQAQALPDDPQAFSAGATKLGNQIQSGANKISKVFSSAGKKYKTTSLDNAFSSDPTCKAIGGIK